MYELHNGTITAIGVGQGDAAMPANVMFVNVLFVLVAALAASKRFPGR